MSNPLNSTLEIKLDAGQSELRLGSVAPVTERKTMQVSSDIHGPYDFYTQKTNLYSKAQVSGELGLWDPFQMLVTVNRHLGTISFQEDMVTTKGFGTIIGSIQPDPALAKLFINKEHRYSAQQLADKLKMNRLLFVDRDAHMVLINSLKNFKAKVDTYIEEANDSKGNKLAMFSQKVAHDYNLKFTLKSPVVLNGPEHVFLVEINNDIRDKSMEFWLESVELHEIWTESIQKDVDEEVQKFKNDSVPVIFI